MPKPRDRITVPEIIKLEKIKTLVNSLDLYDIISSNYTNPFIASKTSVIVSILSFFKEE